MVSYMFQDGGRNRTEGVRFNIILCEPMDIKLVEALKMVLLTYWHLMLRIGTAALRESHKAAAW